MPRLRTIVLLLALTINFWLPALLVAQDSADPQQAGLTIHVVQRGENLFRIALSYGLTTEELAEINGITNPASIQVGQRLLVPATASTDTDQAAPVATPTQAIITDEAAPIIHIVQAGETTFRIATRYGVTVNDIATANGLADPTQIFVGQELVIPGTQSPVIVYDLPDTIASLEIKPTIFTEGESGSFRIVTPAPTTITGTFLNRDLRIISLEDNTLHLFMVGVPIFTEGGSYPVALDLVDGNGASSSFTFDMQILSGGYATTNIDISPEMVELLSPAVEANELSLLETTTSQFTTDITFTGPLGLPAAAPMNAPYGVRRSYNNGEVNRYHSGADFAGAPGTPILAAGPGRVVVADTFNIRGLTTVIDHGWGVYTLYAHQQTQLIAVGQDVVTGQQIGTVGSSGRVTGPHLHWEVWVNGVAVNPMQWTQTIFP